MCLFTTSTLENKFLKFPEFFLKIWNFHFLSHALFSSVSIHTVTYITYIETIGELEFSCIYIYIHSIFPPQETLVSTETFWNISILDTNFEVDKMVPQACDILFLFWFYRTIFLCEFSLLLNVTSLSYPKH